MKALCNSFYLITYFLSILLFFPTLFPLHHFLSFSFPFIYFSFLFSFFFYLSLRFLCFCCRSFYPFTSLALFPFRSLPLCKTSIYSAPAQIYFFSYHSCVFVLTTSIYRRVTTSSSSYLPRKENEHQMHVYWFTICAKAVVIHILTACTIVSNIKWHTLPQTSARRWALFERNMTISTLKNARTYRVK